MDISPGIQLGNRNSTSNLYTGSPWELMRQQLGALICGAKTKIIIRAHKGPHTLDPTPKTDHSRYYVLPCPPKLHIYCI
jgi:hypothetical protein